MKNEFVKICRVSDVYNRKGKSFRLDDENEIALFKVNDVIYAVDNVCPHNHTPQIYDGYIEDMYVACPMHGFRFHLETGEQPTKAGCRLRTFEVMISGDEVYVKKPHKKRFDFHF
ncbi:MAG: nitrite reductase (NAD(P)H) small subunit [Ignavibacteria bacterium]|nr:nitrite reductase (NAD(P)H) small subunit [Ignavibacteria bacterium]